MSINEFTNHVNGLINDYTYGASDGTEFRSGIMSLLIELATPNLKPPALPELEAERLAWSFETFPEATAISSLRKLEGEVAEVEADLLAGQDPTEEYADCLMCLFDSAGRAGITVEQLTEAFAAKLARNKARVWRKNPDNTYSHVK